MQLTSALNYHRCPSNNDINNRIYTTINWHGRVTVVGVWGMRSRTKNKVSIQIDLCLKFHILFLTKTTVPNSFRLPSTTLSYPYKPSGTIRSYGSACITSANGIIVTLMNCNIIVMLHLCSLLIFCTKNYGNITWNNRGGSIILSIYIRIWRLYKYSKTRNVIK